VSAGRCSALSELPAHARALVGSARRGVFATNGSDGSPHAIPVCFALRGHEIVIEIDEKPKAGGVLQRARNIERDPRVAFLLDIWDEDWTQLAWVMVRGVARMEPVGDDPARDAALDALRAKYEQYASMPLDGPVIAIEPRRINWWTWT
jgi:PPOX class probable F420-dependent enzyme